MNAVAEKEAETKLYTCLYTVVQAGVSDAVLKIYPATAPSEKVWLTNRPGVERHEAVMRYLNQYARRGTRVPQPAPYHSDPKSAKSPDLTDDKIPVVNLEDGAVFEVKPEDKVEVPKLAENIKKDADEARFSKIEAVQAAQGAQLGQILSLLQQSLGQAQAPAIAKPSAAETAALAGDVICPEAGCGKPFKNELGLKLHKGKFHKEGK
jgi:hypothetical protein